MKFLAHLFLPIFITLTQSAIFNCPRYEITPPISNLCQFYLLNDPSCYYSQFSYCSYYSGCLQFNGSQCMEQNATKDKNLTSCLQKCCSSLETENLRVYNYLNCDIANSTDNHQSGTTSSSIDMPLVITMAMISIATIIFITLIIKRCILCFRQNQEGSNIEENPQSQRGLNHLGKDEVSLVKEWQPSQDEAGSIKKISEDESCTICLNHSPNCFTDCRHIYHKSCIYQWLKIKNDCPLCKKINIKLLSIYCEKCFLYYYQCKPTQLKASQSEKDKCPECS